MSCYVDTAEMVTAMCLSSLCMDETKDCTEEVSSKPWYFLASSIDRYNPEYVEAFVRVHGKKALMLAPVEFQVDPKFRRTAQKAPNDIFSVGVSATCKKSTTNVMEYQINFPHSKSFDFQLALVLRSYNYFRWAPNSFKTDPMFAMAAATNDGHVSELGIDMDNPKIALAACASWSPSLKYTIYNTDPLFICALLRTGPADNRMLKYVSRDTVVTAFEYIETASENEASADELDGVCDVFWIGIPNLTWKDTLNLQKKTTMAYRF